MEVNLDRYTCCRRYLTTMVTRYTLGTLFTDLSLVVAGVATKSAFTKIIAYNRPPARSPTSAEEATPERLRSQDMRYEQPRLHLGV